MTGLVVLMIGAMSSTALAATEPISAASGWRTSPFAYAAPFFFLGFAAYAVSRKFAAAVAAAAVVGVLGTFLLEYLITGAASNSKRAIVALAILSTLFSWLGASGARLLARERERSGGKRTATSVVAGLILGLGAVGAIAALAYFFVPVPSVRGQSAAFLAVLVCSLAVVAGGAFTIAMGTESIGGTAGSIAFAMLGSLLFFDETGYVIAIYLMTFLPVTILAAWFGALFRRRRTRNAA